MAGTHRPAIASGDDLVDSPPVATVREGRSPALWPAAQFLVDIRSRDLGLWLHPAPRCPGYAH
ncbi:hypothetical protein AB0D11_46940 [Streptomyces monashensis]|uniref:hypothetical protein n=1 Tax=Streptomyces monashensis TaxID=1678012 RepID=UPI0033EB5D7E